MKIKKCCSIDPHGHKVLSHIISPEHHVYAKETASERDLMPAQNTHMRNTSVVFMS